MCSKIKFSTLNDAALAKEGLLRCVLDNRWELEAELLDTTSISFLGKCYH